MNTGHRPHLNASLKFPFLKDLQIGNAGAWVLAVLIFFVGFDHIKNAEQSSTDTGYGFHFNAGFVMG
tara:strand:+ start:565 stop:765 length:201 start_codon:yes stop_codon:yes gene_type:complete